MLKYRNKKVTLDNYKFDSIFESQVYNFLKNNKTLQILDLQSKTYLTDAKILYKPDFKVKNLVDGLIYYVEAKGHETAVWRIKRRLWQFYGPSLLMVYMKKGNKIFLKEVLTPTEKSVKIKSQRI